MKIKLSHPSQGDFWYTGHSKTKVSLSKNESDALDVTGRKLATAKKVLSNICVGEV
jgi:hypothetical protein